MGSFLSRSPGATETETTTSISTEAAATETTTERATTPDVPLAQDNRIGRRRRRRSSADDVADESDEPTRQRRRLNTDNDTTPPANEDTAAPTVTQTTGLQQPTIIRDFLELILFHLIHETHLLRHEQPEPHPDSRVQAFYFCGRFLVNVNEEQESPRRFLRLRDLADQQFVAVRPSAQEAQERQHSSDSDVDDEEEVLTPEEFFERHRHRQETVRRTWLQAGRVLEVDVAPEQESTYQVPLVILGVRGGETTAQESVTENGWSMYVVGVSSSENVMADIERHVSLSPQTNHANVVGLHGRFNMTVTGVDAQAVDTTADASATDGNDLSATIMAILGALVGSEASYESLLRLSEIIGPARPRHAQAEQVERLPAYQYKTTAAPTPVACPICLEVYADEDWLRPLPCGHHFHQECVDVWLCAHVNSCPLCRETPVEENKA